MGPTPLQRTPNMGPNPKPLPSLPWTPDIGPTPSLLHPLSHTPDMRPTPLADTRHGTYPLLLPWTPDMRPTPFHSSLLLTSAQLSLEICSNLFTWGAIHRQYWHLVVATETHTLGKRAVPILLECILLDLLLFWNFHFFVQKITCILILEIKSWTVIVLKITIEGKSVGRGNQLLTLFQKVHFRAKNKCKPITSYWT